MTLLSRGKSWFLVGFPLLGVLLCPFGGAVGYCAPLPPSRLRCEYLTNPLGIDVPEPRFFWVLNHTERGQKQTAYQLLVSTRPEWLIQDKGDQWDSGKVASEESTQVVYRGRPLASGRTYYWKVRYWDAHGDASPYSQPAWFEMGLLARDEWKGKWSTGGNQLRKEFRLDRRVVRARVYITALGYYELRINGEKIGENVLDPAWTTYENRVLYTTYDVTRALQQGANAVGVMLGGGWAVLKGPEWAVVKTPYSSPALLMQMNIELEGGQAVSIVSDASWKAGRGPILNDTIYDGEVYDARQETPRWDRPGFDNSAWSAAQVVNGSAGLLSAQMMPPIRVTDTIVPLKMCNSRPGVFVYDLGQNIAGWAQLRVEGPRGTKVKLRFSEIIYDDGMIDRENLRRAKAEDTYILRGEGKEIYEPHFTYHGFRYVEVTGYPGTPSLDSIRGRVVHTAVETTGSFAASNALLNQIQKIIRWTQLNNLYSVPTDCPQRDERMGWMGDAQLTTEEAMLNFDMAAFYANFVRDIRDAQGPDGSVTDTVPYRGGRRPADPAWGSAYPLICWFMWKQYGDRRTLEENYEGLKKYVDFLGSRAPDHILRDSYYGDWVATEPTPGEYVSAAYYYYDVQTLSKIAEILGNAADAQSYSRLAGQIKEAFNRQFLSGATSSYAEGTQTANSMALFLDLVPQDHRNNVLGSLTNDIVYRHDTHLTGRNSSCWRSPRWGVRSWPTNWPRRLPTQVGVI